MSKLKPGVQQLRRIVIKLMRDRAAEGRCIGMADPRTIEGLADSLERDPSQWFAAGTQLMGVGLIDWPMCQALQNNSSYSPKGMKA